MAREIPLTRGAVALVDDEDYDRLVAIGKWHLSDMGYAVNRKLIDGVQKTTRMHRVVNDTPDGLVTDHINRNRLDNRKSNLRSCTHKENASNHEPALGYSQSKQTGRWVVDIYKYHVGVFSEEGLAAQIAQMIYDGELPLTRIKEYSKYCIRGHDKESTGTYGRSCRLCVLENQKKYFSRTYVPNPREFKEYCPRGHERRLTINHKGDCTICASARTKERKCRLKQAAAN